jgi:thioredoxin-related protein
MKTKFLTTLCAVLTACVVFAAEKPALEGAELGKWTMDIVAAKALAKEANKPVFINFTGSDWCGWCQLMDKNVFSKEEWQTYAAENLVLVWIDFPKNKSLVPAEFATRNRELAKSYKVEGYPTYVLLGADGETVLGQLGADADGSPAAFIQEVERTILVSKLDQVLSAEDYAAWEALKVERKEFDTKVAKWQVQMRKEGEAFQVMYKELEAKRAALLDKAVEAAKK